MLSAFSGFPLYFLTGNLGASLEFFLLCLFINLFTGRRYLSATATLAVFGSVKMIPLLALIPYLWFAKKELRIKISRHLLVVFSMLSLLLGASALSGRGLLLDHFRLVMGGIPDQLSPINEIYFGWSNPTLLFFFRSFAQGMPLYLGVVVLVLLAIWRVIEARNIPVTQKLIFLLLAVFLILPRTKPYFFVSCAPLLAVAMKDFHGRLQQSIIASIALVYPLVSFNKVLENGLTTPISNVFGGASVFSLALTVMSMYLFVVEKPLISKWLIRHGLKPPS